MTSLLPVLAALRPDVLDLVVVVVVLFAVVRGVRMGAVVQVFSYAGFWAGLFLGALVSPMVVVAVHSGIGRAVLSLVVVIGLASLVSALGRVIGGRAWRFLRTVKLGGADAFAGGLVGAASSLLLVWVLAGMLAYAPIGTLSAQIQRSAVVGTLDRTLPPLPSVWSRVQKLASGTGFPQVFAQVDPAAAPPVGLPASPQVAAAVAKDGPSMVKVVGLGCGVIQEGSGFVVSPGLVVTNAHVVAGVAQPYVVDRSGYRHPAEPIYFDPRFDLAVLRVPGLDEPPLVIDPSTVPRGTMATILGYPGGGPFKATPAGIRARFEAAGRDIYGQGMTLRSVYELQGVVIPGNSGGPLVAPNGEVLGVVFSRSVSNPDVGYALASPGVITRVHAAEAHPVPSGTGQCVA